MLFVALPLALVKSPAGVVKAALSVTQPLNKLTPVLVPQRVLGAMHTLQEPGVRPLAMLRHKQSEMTYSNTYDTTTLTN